MSERCSQCENCGPNRTIEIEVMTSSCPKMPVGAQLILDGPIINYERTKGPVCMTAMNALYPWIMLTRFDVYTPDLDFDAEANCYHGVCPCGTVTYDIRKGTPS